MKETTSPKARSEDQTLVARKTEVVETNRQKTNTEGVEEAERIKNTTLKASGKDTIAAAKTYPIYDEPQDSKSLAYDIVSPLDLSEDTFNYADIKFRSYLPKTKKPRISPRL